MGDTITTGGGIHNFTVDKGYDGRPWRHKSDGDWNTLTVKTTEAITLARNLMGIKSVMANPKLTPITFKVEPDAEDYFIEILNKGGDEDVAFMTVIRLRPCPVRLRGAYNQILLRRSRKKEV